VKITSIWERVHVNLISKYAKEGTDEGKNMQQKLIYFDSKLRGKIIEDYLDRCKIRHANLYYEWRSHFNKKMQQNEGNTSIRDFGVN
jgi:hypothetical protein